MAPLLGGTLPLLAWLVAGDRVNDQAVYGYAAAGVLLGFAGAYALTELVLRDRRAAVEQAATRLNRVRLAPMLLRQGGGLTLSARLH